MLNGRVGKLKKTSFKISTPGSKLARSAKIQLVAPFRRARNLKTMIQVWSVISKSLNEILDFDPVKAKRPLLSAPTNLDGRKVGEEKYLKINFMKKADQRGILMKRDENQLGSLNSPFSEWLLSSVLRLSKDEGWSDLLQLVEDLDRNKRFPTPGNYSFLI